MSSAPYNGGSGTDSPGGSKAGHSRTLINTGATADSKKSSLPAVNTAADPRRARPASNFAQAAGARATNSATSAPLAGPGMRISPLARRSLVPTQAVRDRGKMTVVLDVDETLIHSRLSGAQEAYRQDEERKDAASSCDEFKITLSDGEVVWVNKRPGLDEFLQLVAARYEPVVYTAGLEEYAKPLLDWLDPEGKIFRARLYRDSCVFAKGYYVKDLSKIGRDLQRTVLVDNNAFCFLPQLSNGIPISSFYDDPNDSALKVLADFLDRIDQEKDVRPFLRQSFNLHNLLKDHRDQIMGP
jgi:Dullard-like phosphatase family protein